MNQRPSYSVSPDTVFAERLEALFLAELGADPITPVSPTESDEGARTRPGLQRRLVRVGTVAAVMLAVVGALVLAGAFTKSPSRPVLTPQTTTTSPATTSPATTGPALRVPDGAIAPGRYSLATFVVPVNFAIIDDGWSRLLGQRRALLLRRGEASVALAAGQFVADTPQGVVDNVCPGGIELGEATARELLGEPAIGAVGRVTADCTIVLSTFVSLDGSRLVLQTGSDITIITTQVDGELITAFATRPTSPTDIAEIDRLLASFERN